MYDDGLNPDRKMVALRSFSYFLHRASHSPHVRVPDNWMRMQHQMFYMGEAERALCIYKFHNGELEDC